MPQAGLGQVTVRAQIQAMAVVSDVAPVTYGDYVRVQAGKLTDIIVTHRAAQIMFKLVSRRGGEALANTDWAVISPAGDTIAESKGAFPRVILAEGEYKVIARNDNKVYQQDLTVIPGVDGEIEVLAR